MKIKNIIIAICLFSLPLFSQQDSTKVEPTEIEIATNRINAIESAFISNYLELNDKTLETAFMDFYLAATELQKQNEAFKNYFKNVDMLVKELKEAKDYKADNAILKKYGVERQ